jgi:hypothetical protein
MYVHISIPTYGLTKRDQTKLRRAMSTVNKLLTKEGLEQRGPAALSFGSRSRKPSKPARVKVVYVPTPAVPEEAPKAKPRRRKPKE